MNLPAGVGPPNPQMWHHVRGLLNMINSHLKIPFLVNCTTLNATHKNIWTNTLNINTYIVQLRKFHSGIQDSGKERIISTWQHDLQVVIEGANFYPATKSRKYYFVSYARRPRYPRKVSTKHLEPSGRARASLTMI